MITVTSNATASDSWVTWNADYVITTGSDISATSSVAVNISYWNVWMDQYYAGTTGSASTSIITSDGWRVWNAIHQEAEEDRIQREAKAADAARKREEARARAEALLTENLDKEQVEQFRKERAFVVHASKYAKISASAAS